MGKFTFAGTTIVAPGFILRSTINVQRVLQLLPFGKILMAGPSDGGLGGGTIYEFNDMNTALKVLRGGALYKALAAAARIGGASGFVGVVCGTKVAASATIAGSAGASMTLTAGDQGSWTNSIKYQISAGSTSGFAFTLQYPDQFGNIIVVGGPGTVYDNLVDMNALATVIANDALLTPPAVTGFQPIVIAHVATNGVPTNASLTALSGGAGDGSATLLFADYKTGIDAIIDEPFDIGHLVGGYSTQAQAYADGQADQVAPKGYLRRWIHQCVPTGVSPTNSKMTNSSALVNYGVGQAAALNEKRAMLVGQQFQVLDPMTGLPTWMDAAPIMCGYAALVGVGANGPATPMTQDIIPTVTDVNYTVLNATGDQDNAILGGFTVFEKLNSGVRCVQSVTTAPNDPSGQPWIYAEFSVMRVVDAVAANIKAAIESSKPKGLGAGNTVKNAGHLLSLVRDVLEDALEANWITAFDQSAISFQPVQGSPTDAVITWDMTPVFPLNHLGLDQTIQPFSITAQFLPTAA